MFVMDVPYIIHCCNGHHSLFVLFLRVTIADKRMVAGSYQLWRIPDGAHVTQGVWQQHAPCNSAGFARPAYPLTSAVRRVAKPYV